MSSAEMQDEDSPNGTQEATLGMPEITLADGGAVIWDPVSKSYVRAEQERKPDMHQVPGTPASGVDFQEKTQNPQFEGVFARTSAVRMVQLSPEDDWGVYSDRVSGPYKTPLVYRGTFDECRAWVKSEGRYASHVASFSPEPENESARFKQVAEEFREMAEHQTTTVQKIKFRQKADYYDRMALMYAPKAGDPAATQADNAGPASTSESDVFNDVDPKRNPGMTDDSFPAMISHHIPKVTSMPTSDRFNNHDRITLGSDEANLRDCPNGCGGLMGDYDGESVCHNCGQREKVHYAQEKDAGFLAPLVAPLAEGAIGEAAGAAASGAAEGLGSSGVTNALRAGSLMQRVMGGGGGGGGAQAESPDSGEGSAVANDNMQSTGGFMDDSWADFDAQTVDPDGPWDGIPSWQYSGDAYTDLGVAEEKLQMGEITNAEYSALLDRAQRTVEDDGSLLHEDPDEARNMEELGWYQGDDGRVTNDFGRSASSVSDEDGLYGNNESGHDSEPDSGNKGSEGQDMSADELNSDNDGDGGGSKAMTGEQLFLTFEKYLESIADNPDSHNDPIAKAVHEALLGDDPDYLSKAARYEISKIAGGTCPTCHIDLTTANQCGGPSNVTCPVGLPHGGQSVMPAGQDPGAMGQPMSQPMSAVIHEAKRPKMCPAHEHLVNYALTLQDPAAALGAFAGQLFGEHSCQGGYELLNSAGNAVKCKYKPEMITQSYWDEKEALAEQRKQEREQQQALMTEQQVQQPVVQVEPEGQLVGGPALDEQFEQQQVQEKQPVTQDIPSVDAAPIDQDYIPAEQGAEVIQFPQRQQQEFNQTQVAASYKWSGPGMLTPELAPSETPEQMFSDNPPEELPSESAVGGDDLLDTEGNPVEIGMTYEVQSPRADDTIPDKYTITGKDSNLISFKVGDDEAPIQFDDNLSVAQIRAEGLTFTPVAGDPNSFGDVEPSGNSDATGESDQPGSVTDLDTGGNSHASKTAVNNLNGFETPDSDVWDMSLEPTPVADERGDPFATPVGAKLNELIDVSPEEMWAILEALNPGHAGEDPHAHQQSYSDSDYDDGGEGDEPYDRDPTRTGATMEGNAKLDWLNEKTAGRDYSLGEQRGFVNESGDARNLDKLDLSGTHYPVAGSDDPYDNFLW